jgi:galactoside O-acetyltransferase
MNLIIHLLKRWNARRKQARWAPFLELGEGILFQSGFGLSGKLGHSSTKVKIGKDSLIASQFVFEREGHGQVVLGERVHAGSSTQFISVDGITVGNDVTIAFGCTFYDHNSHSVNWEERKNDTLQEIADTKSCGDFIAHKDWSNVRSAPILVKDKAWIGFGVTVLKGVTVGEGAVVGARSVVTRDVPPYTVVAGNPAQVVKTLLKGGAA